jgi:predicted RNA-binding protein with PIN domain
MPFLIDGHNLIPRLGLRLDALDDELDLIERLNEFCRRSRRGNLEVYFDNAAAGVPASRKNGCVTAYFVRKPRSADDAMRTRLKKLGRSAQNWTVVSSDYEIQAAANASGAKVISSDEFARTVIETLPSGPAARATDADRHEHKDLSDGEVQEWLKAFNDRDRKFGQF